MRGKAMPARQRGRRRGATAAALVGLVIASIMIVPLLAAPAAAVGATVEVYVQPPRSVGTPSKGSAGPADLVADATVYGASSSAGNLVFTVTNNMEWEASPSTGSMAVPAGGGRFTFEFQILVPEDAVAGVTTGVEVRAEYRVGPATVATGVGGASVEAGKYYGASVRRVTASEPMSPGRTYVIEYDVLNEGNAGSVMTFHWLDPGLLSRLKADFEEPMTLSLGGHENRTAAFRITPQGTTPDGTVEVPVQMVITDRTGTNYGHVNFSIEMEFENLPIYPGILPRLDLHGVSTVLGWFAVFFVLWLALNAAVAFRRRGDFDEGDGLPFLQAYAARLTHSLLYRGVRRVLKRGGRRRRRARRAEDA